MKKSLWQWAGVSLMLTLLAACIGNKVYYRYDHTPLNGWEKNDTLTFSVPKMPTEGLYNSHLLLRVSQGYPFMSLALIVEQTVLPSHQTHTDTLKCRLIDERGRTKGQGLNYYQYSFPINSMHLQAGDSLQIKVRHDMKREILPGVSDIGIQILRQ